MPSKKGPQSKDQQPSQSQNQAPPLTATAAATGKLSQDQSQQMSLLQENADPVSACMSVVDRKVRNLDKRKVCAEINILVTLYSHVLLDKACNIEGENVSR